ncbi:MAG: M48 family metallopeptidase [Pseudomonadota bacterium]
MSQTLSAADLRSRDDLSMYESLLKDRTVVRTNERIARMEEDNPYSIRRRLLATSVRLSERMAPELHAMARDCIDKLQMETPLELFAFASPQYNAMCFKPEDGRLFVMFASSLLEAFDENELKYVVGHELGHHVYRHHDIPIGFILNGKSRPDPRLALSLFTWSRYAEISADRAGAHCADDIEAVSRALFKLASGLSGKGIRFSLDDFLKQVDEMQMLDSEASERTPREDWFSTHPFSPLRVKALQLFDRSILARPDGTSLDDLEVGTQGLMSLMEPSYMEGRTEVAEGMRRLLFAGSLVVANADGNITEEEIAIFEKFFGKGAFTDSLNLESIEQELPGRIAAVKEEASLAQRMQVIRDLCLVARAEGHDQNTARLKLYEIAGGLDVPAAFIEQSMCSELTPD